MDHKENKDEKDRMAQVAKRETKAPRVMKAFPVQTEKRVNMGNLVLPVRRDLKEKKDHLGFTTQILMKFPKLEAPEFKGLSVTKGKEE